MDSLSRALISSILLLSVFSPFGCGAIALTDLDLSQLQTDAGPLRGTEQYRTDDGMILTPGASLWVDLKKDAKSLRATVEPLPGSGRAPVRCRFSTANSSVEVTVSERSAPQEVKLSLQGEELLVVESRRTQDGECIRVHITSSAIDSQNVRPEAWGGGAPAEFSTPQWSVRIDGRSGGISHLAYPKDKYAMEWVRSAAPWGTGWAKIGDRTEAWVKPKTVRVKSPQVVESVYELSRLRVQVTRSIEADGNLKESYEFENRSDLPLIFGENGIGIRVPLMDNYPGAEVCLPQRCHAHLWMGGHSAYINAMRMGGEGPHLGLILVDGSLTNYSIYDRIDNSDDRGQFVLHPAPLSLAPGEKTRISWVLFWHQGWNDFFMKAASTPGFTRLSADRYAIPLGENVQVRVEGAINFKSAKVTLNGEPIPTSLNDRKRTFEILPTRLGEQWIQVDAGNGRTTLRIFVHPPVLKLIEARVRFILDHQQVDQPGDPLNGAFLIYDNELNRCFVDSSFADHNAARERLAMGTLLALYAQNCSDPALAARLTENLTRYSDFVKRELQNNGGEVFNDVGRKGPVRMYNYPWVAHFYLAMYQTYRKPEYLRRSLDACRDYYAKGGERFYCIGLPILGLLNALKQAGWNNEAVDALSLFRKHAETLLAIGKAYPKHEVNYEQSIVGPAAQIMLEVYLATGEKKFLEGAKSQLALLELFGGQQPDYHLHDIAIRHWDDYWFGKRQIYGDTFPHYWSTISARVFCLYARANGDSKYASRGEGIFASNFCLFSPDGRASCAYVYPLSVNAIAGQFFDPWANDQDWALVNWLTTLGPRRNESSVLEKRIR